MSIVNTDGPVSLRSRPRRRVGKRIWLIRGGLLSIHLAMLGADLFLIGIWRGPRPAERAGAAPAGPTLPRTLERIGPDAARPASRAPIELRATGRLVSSSY